MKMCLCQVQPAHIVCEDIIAQRYGAGSQSLQLFSTVFCCVLFVSFTRSAALESVHLSLSMNTHTYTHTAHRCKHLKCADSWHIFVLADWSVTISRLVHQFRGNFHALFAVVLFVCLFTCFVYCLYFLSVLFILSIITEWPLPCITQTKIWSCPSLQPLNVSVSLCFSPLERFWHLSLGQSAALWPFEKVAMWVPASHWSSFPVQCLLNPRDRYKLLNRKHAKKKNQKWKRNALYRFLKLYFS